MNSLQPTFAMVGDFMASFLGRMNGYLPLVPLVCSSFPLGGQALRPVTHVGMSFSHSPYLCCG
jgi:hypothetical protein